MSDTWINEFSPPKKMATTSSTNQPTDQTNNNIFALCKPIPKFRWWVGKSNNKTKHSFHANCSRRKSRCKKGRPGLRRKKKLPWKKISMRIFFFVFFFGEVGLKTGRVRWAKTRKCKNQMAFVFNLPILRNSKMHTCEHGCRCKIGFEWFVDVERFSFFIFFSFSTGHWPLDFHLFGTRPLYFCFFFCSSDIEIFPVHSYITYAPRPYACPPTNKYWTNIGLRGRMRNPFENRLHTEQFRWNKKLCSFSRE